MVKPIQWRGIKTPPLAALCLLVFGVLTAHAIEIAPSYQMLKTKSGGRVEGELRLTNTEDSNLNVIPESKEWQAIEVNKDIEIDDWLKIDKKPFVLKPGESRTVHFSALAPKKARGELMGMLTFTTKTDAATPQMITFKLSTAVYLEIEKTQSLDASVEGLQVQITSDTVIGIMLLNKGNVHLRPRGFVEVRDAKNQIVANVTIGQSQPSFPGIPRPFFGTVKNFRLAEGKYTAVISIHDVDHNIDFPQIKKKFAVTSLGEVQAE